MSVCLFFFRLAKKRFGSNHTAKTMSFIDFERRYPPGKDHISPPSMFESMIFRTSQVGICDSSLEGKQFIVLPDLIWIARAVAIIQLKVPW